MCYSKYPNTIQFKSRGDKPHLETALQYNINQTTHWMTSFISSCFFNLLGGSLSGKAVPDTYGTAEGFCQPVLVDFAVSCHHNISLLPFLHLSFLHSGWVLGTFSSCVTSSGHKATTLPQPCLPNVLHKVQLCGFPPEQGEYKDLLCQQKHQFSLSGCTRYWLWPICFQVKTEFKLEQDSGTGGRCSEMPESTKRRSF